MGSRRRNRAIRKWGRRALIAVGVLAVAALAIFWGPITERTAEMKRESNWDAALAAAEAGEWRTALEKADLVARELPDDLAVKRITLRAALETENWSRLSLASEVFKHRESTLDDKALCLEYLLAGGEIDEFKLLQRFLSPEEHRHPDIYLQISRFIASQGGKEFALRRIRAVPMDGDGSRRPLRLLMARTLLREDPTAAELREAQSIMASLLPEQDETALEAIELVHDVPFEAINSELFPADFDWVLENPRADVSTKLAAHTLRLALTGRTGENRQQILTEAVDEFSDFQLVALGDWLLRIGRHDVVLDMVDAKLSAGSKTLFEQRFQALIAAGRLEEVAEALGNPHRDTTRQDLRALEAVTYLRLGETVEAARAWREAMAAAGRSGARNPFDRLSRLAVEAGQPAWAAEATVEACRSDKADLLPASEMILVFDQLLGDNRIPEAQSVNAVLLRREPDNPFIHNRQAYLSVLGGEKLNPAIRTAQFLVSSFPSITIFRATCALALAKSGRTGEAVEVIDEPGLDWSTAPPTAHLIRALVYQEGGKPGLAGEAARAGAGAQLFPAEEMVLRRS